MTAPGCLIVVVGPSGAGKDTVMQHAANNLAGEPRLVLLKRIITRSESAGGEDHCAVEQPAFDEMAASGAFAVHWHAHGLSYGIPVEAQDLVRQGKVVVVNGSRAALNAFRAAFPGLMAVNITAGREVLASRLASRRREETDAIERRLARAEAIDVSEEEDVVTIDNSGPLEAAVSRFVAVLEAALGKASVRTD